MLSPSILTETEGEREFPQHLRLPPIKTLRVEAPRKAPPPVPPVTGAPHR